MLPVLEMASVHNVELVKFFFKLLYQADTRRADSTGMYLSRYNFLFILFQISVTGKWTLLDENNEAFVCFTFPIKISH